ncbi:hypothetical protein HER10_EVM0012881 [Colletotrichum scovillei]|uniref:Uncharacterized protein n=1 Tax=Colletotrichum scovillei TaxID=1209932 RepID=A0A9P7UFH2_9PEZI|nr:uncharacterized protein HER10_EVM0012881 [Colletotrichum scovillei]KAF4782487.1 hypothetical protein HER10_EVM0012881 [Colletotrichum scovillei]KAG7050687.1 hypothetical protein JMJ77_0013430 [Colletotrichum scovillei]KAG7069733.1 hypothetical protein JMJ76_0003396 [Colletotrichum scovillei]KAG7073679.1 hypothetical protein JMJ78_0014649 [Colletotrichum scovillei]
MENIHAQRRSASHGSLRSSYKSHARPPIGYGLPRRPLRSVNENASLLPSPGPLESMLKTTTETGDIGIFSIKPIAPAATTHQCARSRTGLDVNTIFRSESRASHRTISGAGRRWNSSDRDTNSEIISMYGSEGPPTSFSSSFSPKIDGPYQRSYSLTTCGSRKLSSKKSSGTLQSHSSSGILQRPRSPFPYPTRLKRPGVRPSSPALTENGLVDYSRMVEIDRISYRTVHGSYKPTFPQPQRFGPSNAFPGGINQSMPSLPHSNSFVSPTGSALGYREYHYPWGNELASRPRRPSTDHSARSSSLTSVIEMYYRSPSNSEPNLSRAIRPAGSFYYDYTEAFETPERQTDPRDSTLALPLAPIPQRASSLTRALVLRDETKARLDAVVDISVKDSSDSSGDDCRALAKKPANDIETLPSQRLSSRTTPPMLEQFPFEVDGTSASRPVDVDNDLNMSVHCSQTVDTATFQQSQTTPKPQNIGHNNVEDEENAEDYANTSRGHEQGNEGHTTEANADTSHPAVEHTTGHTTGAPSESHFKSADEIISGPNEPSTLRLELLNRDRLSRRAPSHSGLAALLRSSLRHSVEPGLSDLAALVSSFERIARSPFMSKDEDPTGLHEVDADESKDLKAEMEHNHPLEGGNMVNEFEANGATHPDLQWRPFFRGHRRNRALARISTASLRSHTAPPASKADNLLLSSTPIPTNHYLSTSSSVPHLMKALPSLPKEAQAQLRRVSGASGDDLRFPVKFSPFQLEILATPRSSPRITAHSDVEDHESFRASIEHEVIQPRREHKQAGHDAPSPKMKVTVVPSPSKQKLRLKASRLALNVDTIPEDQNGTVRRRSSVKQSILADLPAHQAKDLFTPVRHEERQGSMAYRRKGRRYVQLTPSDGENLPARVSPTARYSRDGHLHERDIPLAHPVDTNLYRLSASPDGFDLSDSRSFSSDLTFFRPRILKKKLSNLRLRLTKSRLNLRERVNKRTGRRPQPTGLTGSKNSDATVVHSEWATATPGHSKQVRRRMKRWVRQAVSICVKGRRNESEIIS